MSDVTIPAFLSLALDPVRRAVLGKAAIGPVDVAALAQELGLEERKVFKEVGRLAAAELLDAERRLNVEILRSLARSVPTDAPIDPSLLEGPWTDEEARMLSRFFSGRRLTSIPTARLKRLLVLERLALEFEPGMRYHEREVNFTLQMFFADYAALRRYLVDEGLMTRADGVYWRTGGRVAKPSLD